MKTFLRYFGIVSGLQVALWFVAVLMVRFSPQLEFLLNALLFIYAPTIYLFSSLGDFYGSSAIVYPMLLGIPSGVLLYAFLLGYAIKRCRT